MIDRKRAQEDAGIAVALRMLRDAWPNEKRFNARDAVPLAERGSLSAALLSAGLRTQPDFAGAPEYGLAWQLRSLLNRLMLVDKTVLALRAVGSGPHARFYVEALATVGMPAAAGCAAARPATEASETGDRPALLDHWCAVVEGLTTDELAELPEPVLALLDFIAGLENSPRQSGIEAASPDRPALNSKINAGAS
jgi:hypothetical protein